MSSLDIKIAGEEPAVPQILKIDAIWVVAVQVATETLESSAEKAGFCIFGDVILNIYVDGASLLAIVAFVFTFEIATGSFIFRSKNHCYD